MNKENSINVLMLNVSLKVILIFKTQFCGSKCRQMVTHSNLNHITNGRRHFVLFEVLYRVPYLPSPIGYTSRFISPNNPIIAAGVVQLLLLTGLWVGRRRL